MKEEFREPVKKKVGGSLSQLDPLRRLDMQRANALMLRGKSGQSWTPPRDDGTPVRKTVGWPREAGGGDG